MQRWFSLVLEIKDHNCRIQSVQQLQSEAHTTVVPTSSEHDHSTKQELSYQPKLHQFMCYRVKRQSRTVICIHPMNAASH